MKRRAFLLASATAVAGIAAGGSGARPRRPSTEGLRGKVMTGYQGWFRCPGDRANVGWDHWSRDWRRIAPETLTFEMWPDMSECRPAERFPAAGFTDADGRTATLFSSEHPDTVARHFRWMREHDIDGAWMQHFCVALPGGPLAERYPSRLSVLGHVRRAAARAGRVWALAYDIAAMPIDDTYRVLTDDWRRCVDTGITSDPRYVREGGKPVALIWGFYRDNVHNKMTPALANRLIDFFRTPGPYAACLVGGGDWHWRQHADPAWQAFVRRFDAYAGWNIGNYTLDEHGAKHANTGMWEDDRKELEAAGVMWLPVVYPGFSWDNLQRLKPGTSLIERRGGRFLWEQFVTLARMKADSAYLAMFDEVDEGTALFKVTSSPPRQAHFVGYEGLPPDWYLRLTREGIRMMRGGRPIADGLPFAAPRR